jgi:hypothetical protein
MNHRRLKLWRSFSTLERGIFAALAEMRADVDLSDESYRETSRRVK